MEWNPSDAAWAELCEDIVEHVAESLVERSVAFCPRSARHEFTCKLHDAATSVTACARAVSPDWSEDVVRYFHGTLI